MMTSEICRRVRISDIAMVSKSIGDLVILNVWQWAGGQWRQLVAMGGDNHCGAVSTAFHLLSPSLPLSPALAACEAECGVMIEEEEAWA